MLYSPYSNIGGDGRVNFWKVERRSCSPVKVTVEPQARTLILSEN